MTQEIQTFMTVLPQMTSISHTNTTHWLVVT